MKIAGDALPRQLRGPLRPLYWVSGDETLLAQEATDRIRQHCQGEGFAEREVWHIDSGSSANWQAILLSANSLSLFAERKLLELRFASGKPGEAALKALADYCGNPNPDCVVLACSPKLDAASTRSRAFKALEAGMLWVQVWPVEAPALPAWIGSRLAARGLKATPEALALLAERVAGNLLAARQEVDKLALLAPPEGVVDAEIVVRSVADSARFDVFDLVEHVLRADASSAVRTLNGLRGEGTEAPVVLWALSRELRRLISIRQAIERGGSADAAINAQGVWKHQQGLFRQASSRLTSAQLRHAAQTARAADSAIKGGAGAGPWDLLTALALELCGTPLWRAAPAAHSAA